MAQEKSFLGTGWSFPPTFDKTIKNIVMVSDEEDIQQSLKIILGTQVGERVMQSNFGSGLDTLVFEPINLSIISLVKDIIEKSILIYEPRIEAEAINIDSTDDVEGILRISVDYRIKSTNTRNNIVFPFYLNEGNNINS